MCECVCVCVFKKKKSAFFTSTYIYTQPWQEKWIQQGTTIIMLICWSIVLVRVHQHSLYLCIHASNILKLLFANETKQESFVSLSISVKTSVLLGVFLPILSVTYHFLFAYHLHSWSRVRPTLTQKRSSPCVCVYLRSSPTGRRWWKSPSCHQISLCLGSGSALTCLPVFIHFHFSRIVFAFLTADNVTKQK